MSIYPCNELHVLTINQSHSPSDKASLSSSDELYSISSVKLGNPAVVQCLYCSVVTETGDKFSLL